MQEGPAPHAAFPTTIPHLVRSLMSARASKHREAWDEFYRRYARPLLVFAILKRGLPMHDGEDLVHSFLSYLLEKPRLERFDPQVGRFRTYLLTLFMRFVKDEQVKAKAVKRGGGKLLIGGLEERLELYRDRRADPREAFAREWALGTVQDSISLCEELLQASGETDEQEWLRIRYKNPLQTEGDRPSSRETGRRLGLTPARIRTVDKRVKSLLRSCFEKHVRADLMDPDREQKKSRILIREGIDELLEALAG